MSQRLPKHDTLSKYPGIRVYNEGRNDGLYIHLRKGIWKIKDKEGKPKEILYDNVSFVEFFDSKEGHIYWKARSMKTKKGGTQWHNDIISVPRVLIPKIIEALQKLMGESKEEIGEKLEQEKLSDELRGLAEEF